MNTKILIIELFMTWMPRLLPLFLVSVLHLIIEVENNHRNEKQTDKFSIVRLFAISCFSGISMWWLFPSVYEALSDSVASDKLTIAASLIISFFGYPVLSRLSGWLIKKTESKI